jgi:hypothetical protein
VPAKGLEDLGHSRKQWRSGKRLEIVFLLTLSRKRPGKSGAEKCTFGARRPTEPSAAASLRTTISVECRQDQRASRHDQCSSRRADGACRQDQSARPMCLSARSVFLTASGWSVSTRSKCTTNVPLGTISVPRGKRMERVDKIKVHNQCASRHDQCSSRQADGACRQDKSARPMCLSARSMCLAARSV